VKIFRDHDKPNIDLDRLADTLAKVRQRQVELERTITRLNREMPGNAEAIAAAGIAFRASINRSASMIELGTAAVEALRIAGYAITSPLAARPPVTPSVKPIESQRVDDIPDDWATG
jgi:hypothetical protein